MKKLQKILSMALICSVVMGLVGCAPKFDATAFVQATLDLVTKKEVQQYAEIMDITTEEAEEEYKEAVEEMGVDAAMEASGLPESFEESFTEYMMKVLAKTKYTVLEAKEEDGNYIVEVEVEPIMIFDGVTDELMTKANDYVTQVQTDVANGAAIPSDEEMTNKVYEMMMEILNTKLDTVEYSEKIVVETRIVKNDDGNYEVDEESFEKLGESLIDMTGIEATE